MRLKNIVAVSGLSGLQELIVTKNNGLILKDFKTDKTSFYSIRKYQFTPLETVGIYTNAADTVDIKTVLQTMYEKLEETPPVPAKSERVELFSYFSKILPDFDKDRVYPSDIKKLIKWFNELNELGFLTATDEEVINEKENDVLQPTEQ